MKTAGERVVLALLGVVVGWFYVWTVDSSGEGWGFGKEQNDYYNLLIDGWLDGHLHLKVDVPAELLRLKDPYDPTVRPPGLGLHDASFYRGHYYLYFGAAPVVTLMLPFRLLTGTDLPLPAAAVIFVYAGFLASLATWLAVRRRYFPESGPIVVLLVGLVLGLAALGPVLLRRPHMWELPIGAGYAFAMLALFCVWQSLHADARRTHWFAGAGLALGLAIASRPTYLIASPFLAVPVLWWWRAEGRPPWRTVLGALGPLAVIGLAMAWHNYARFGHPLQFGQAYQFSLDYESRMAHFRAGHVPFNLWRYFFSVAEWSRYFPFIAPAVVPPKPPGFGGHDDVYGILTNLPIAWLALAAPLAGWRRDAAERGPLVAWLLTAGVLFAGMAGTLLMFFGSLARYQSDFTPTLMLLAGVGVLGLERWLRGQPRGSWRFVARLGWGGAALFSALFAVLFSLQLNSFLQEKNPGYRRVVAQRLNQVPATVERWLGREYGPLELDVWFARSPAGTRHLLVVAGKEPQADRLFVRYEEGERVRFELQSSFGITFLSPLVALDFSATHPLRLTLGSLLPPDDHPLLAGLPVAEVAAARRWLTLDLDGRRLFDELPWFATPGGAVKVGVYAVEAEGPLYFSGAVMAARRDQAGLVSLVQAAGVRARRAQQAWAGEGGVRLRLMLPADRGGFREPLVVTGRPGRGDMVMIEYVDGAHVRFGLDHWGSPMRTSPVVPVDFGAEHEVTVHLVSLSEAARSAPRESTVSGRLRVALDGRVVWDEAVDLYIVVPIEVAIARNPIGGTSCEPMFSGRVLAVGNAQR